MIKLTMSLPADAAARLLKLLNSDTPEGKQAREDLGVVSAKPVMPIAYPDTVPFGDTDKFDSYIFQAKRIVQAAQSSQEEAGALLYTVIREYIKAEKNKIS